MNKRLLARPNCISPGRNVVFDSANLDFTTLPDWDNDHTLDEPCAGTRGSALPLPHKSRAGLLLRRG
ncbi:MAG: hypothetical protein OXN89_00700 [Bryobacterales bacterium]|nr:hypothetical protein [Bryobacterales bacterium]